MPRSHPPTLLRIVERTLREECGLEAGERWLVAVSGGPDSIALLHVLHCLSARLGFSLAAHGVNHGLRAEATRELFLARQLADRLGVEYTETSLRVLDGGNLQARARAARLNALDGAARNAECNRIATAHHADDRAETVLIRLLSGTTPRGLAVIPARDGYRIRPLIRARRADVMRHVERHGLQFAFDPSNRDARFLRSRIRQEVLPLLEELSPGIVGHLNALADEASPDPIPPIVDEGGQSVPLRRSHRAQIRRALAVGQRPTLVRLPGNRQIRVDPRSASLTVIQDPSPRRSGG